MMHLYYVECGRMNEPQLLTSILTEKNEWFRVGFCFVFCSRCIGIKNTHETIVIISEFGSQCTRNATRLYRSTKKRAENSENNIRNSIFNLVGLVLARVRKKCARTVSQNGSSDVDDANVK